MPATEREAVALADEHSVGESEVDEDTQPVSGTESLAVDDPLTLSDLDSEVECDAAPLVLGHEFGDGGGETEPTSEALARGEGDTEKDALADLRGLADARCVPSMEWRAEGDVVSDLALEGEGCTVRSDTVLDAVADQPVTLPHDEVLPDGLGADAGGALK